MSPPRGSLGASGAESAGWHGFVTAWWRAFRDDEVGVDDLLPHARGAGGLGLGWRVGGFRAARLGRLLRERRGCVVDGYRITPTRVVSGQRRWRLLPLEDLVPVHAAAPVPASERREAPDGRPWPPGGHRPDPQAGRNRARRPSHREATAGQAAVDADDVAGLPC